MFYSTGLGVDVIRNFYFWGLHNIFSFNFSELSPSEINSLKNVKKLSHDCEQIIGLKRPQQMNFSVYLYVLLFQIAALRIFFRTGGTYHKVPPNTHTLMVLLSPKCRGIRLLRIPWFGNIISFKTENFSNNPATKSAGSPFYITSWQEKNHKY